MCKVKVKLLNGEDQLIEFEEQMTVLDLKEKINKRLNVPTENQRLIYCGRILQNEKKLQEYDLDNKVIHLVDSPPNLDANNQPRPTEPDNATMIGSSHFSIDINLNSANVHNNAESRIQNITRILGYINRAIDKLEQDPNLPSPSYETNFDSSSAANDTAANNSSNNFADNMQTSTQSITQVGILLPSDNRAESTQPNQNFLNQISQEITDILFNLNGQNRPSNNANTNATNSTASNTATRNQTSSATNQPPPQSSLGSLIGSLAQGILGGSLGNSISQLNIPTVNITSNNSTQSNNSTTASNSTNTNAQPPRNRRITWAEYANLLDNLRQTQERFTPHFNSFQNSLLQRHGSLSASQAEEEQAKYRLIARCMHHLSHVYHMCSDIYINYTHQQDQTIQVFEPLMRRPPPTSATELVMSSGAINLSNLGNGLIPPSSSNSTTANATGSTTSLAELANRLNHRSGTSSGANLSTTQRLMEMREQRRRTSTTVNAASLPNSNNLTNPNNVQTESQNNQTSNINRRDSGWYVLSGPTMQEQQQSTETTSGNRPERTMLQRLFGASLPDLTSSNNLTINGQPMSSNNASVINLTTIQPATVIVQSGRNASGNQSQQSQLNNNPLQQNVNNLRDSFNLASDGSTQPQQRMNIEEEATASQTNNQSSTTTNSQQQAPRTNQRVRVPTLGQQIVSGFPHSYVHNFDPHLPCTSTWLKPEIRGRLEVDLQIPNVENFRPTTETTTTTTNNDTNASHSTLDNTTETTSAATHQQPSTSVRTRLDTTSLFEELKRLFSSYLERDELLRRIDRLPITASNSLSSFINSIEILDLMKRNKSNITLELFMILAQEISVREFLKIIFTQDFKCLNRAKDSMIHYAKTNLLFNNEEPFDISSSVDELLNIWKKVLTSSLDELKSEFSERTFSALLSELRANLSVFLRTFTRTFDTFDNESNSFASSLYFAIQRLFVDFHTSLSQMFRNPVNVMRAYKNILIQIFPNSNVRNIVVAILSYRIPAIDESEPTLERNRFNSRVLNLTDQPTVNNKPVEETSDFSVATSFSSSGQATPMEIDIDDVIQTVNTRNEREINLNYGSENWHFKCPKNWISILKNDRDKIFRKQNAINSKLSFSSIYRDAYKKN